MNVERDETRENEQWERDAAALLEAARAQATRLAQARRGVAAAKGIRDDFRLALEGSTLWRDFQVAQDGVGKAQEVERAEYEALAELALACREAGIPLDRDQDGVTGTCQMETDEEDRCSSS